MKSLSYLGGLLSAASAAAQNKIQMNLHYQRALESLKFIFNVQRMKNSSLVKFCVLSGLMFSFFFFFCTPEIF